MLYTTAGRPTAAIVQDPQAIVDTKLYWIPCETIDEANYLMAIINSRTLEEAVAGLMSKGQFGSRDLHKHLWRLPIPTYDPSVALHQEIAMTSQKVATGAARVTVQTQMDRATFGKAASVKVVRSEIRTWLDTSKEAQELESSIQRLLT